MGMTAASMAARRKAALDAVPAVQSSTPGDALAYREAVLLADSQAIIDEIQQNAVVTTTSGAPDGEHTGQID
jgi:hypothetical protein